RKPVEQDAPCRQIEAGDLAEQHADVLVALEDPAQRRGDLARRERAGRDLVHERLEQVEVATIDQRDLDRLAAQPPHGLQAAEPAADDDDAVAATFLGLATARSARPLPAVSPRPRRARDSPR